MYVKDKKLRMKAIVFKLINTVLYRNKSEMDYIEVHVPTLIKKLEFYFRNSHLASQKRNTFLYCFTQITSSMLGKFYNNL